MRLITLFLSVFSTLFVCAQAPTPAPEQAGPILILGATAHLGDGRVIDNSAVAFDKGKLTLVADATTIRFDRGQFSKIFDATGKHVYPGFIGADTQLGLVEIEAVRATVDNSEVGSINPNVRAIIAYNTDSDVIPTVRSNGVLLAHVVPTSGRFSGTSSVVQLDAWNWEDAALRTDGGMHLNWPYQRPSRAGRERPQAGPDPTEQQMQELEQFFDQAKAYCALPNAMPQNQRFESMRGVFSGKQTLFIHTDLAKSIQEAVLFAEKYQIHPVIVGGNDSWMITDFLNAHAVPVVLNKSQRLPSREDEDIDQPYKTAAALQQAGVLFCISEEGSWRQRNLPFEAGQAVGAGLPYEAAVSAISLNAAKIMGIADRCGSIEVGKDATLFISEGDALDMRTLQVTAAFIQGREISLDNKQKELSRRFEEKYKRQ